MRLVHRLASIRSLMRSPLLLVTAFLTTLVAPAQAAPLSLPDNRTVDLTINVIMDEITETTPTNGRRTRKTSQSERTLKFRLFKLKDQLIISGEDFGKGEVFSGGISRTKNAYRVGRHNYDCKDVDLEGGGVDTTCYKYETNGNIFQIHAKYSVDGMAGSIQRTDIFNVTMHSNDCVASLVRSEYSFNPYAGTFLPQPGVRSQQTTGKARFNGSSCRLLQGRQAF